MAVVLSHVFLKKSADPNASAIAGVAVSQEDQIPRDKGDETKLSKNMQVPVAEVSGPSNELVDFLESHEVEPMDPMLVKMGERIAWGANGVFSLVL
jgi:hypothetical protein